MEYSKRKGNGLSGDCSGASHTLSYLPFEIFITFVIVENYDKTIDYLRKD